jgi:hypothetical protein
VELAALEDVAERRAASRGAVLGDREEQAGIEHAVHRPDKLSTGIGRAPGVPVETLAVDLDR